MRDSGSERGLKVAALAGLYSLYKRLKRTGAPLLAAAESTHRHGRDLDWNESWYFNFTDPEKGIGGYTRIGILPNQESDIGVMMLFAGGKRLLSTRQGGRVTAEGTGLSIGGLEYGCVEPLVRWRLRYSGQMEDFADAGMLTEAPLENSPRVAVEVDLLFEGLAPCFNFKDADPRALARMLVRSGTKLSDARSVSRVSSEHYEQAGLCSGTIRIGDEVIEFEGSGHRDHSWGVRDWSAPRLWTWLTCQFPDGVAFNLSRVAIKSVDIFNGFISRDGRNYPVASAVLETEFEQDGLTQKLVRFRMEDTGGKRIEVTGDVRVVIPLDLRSRGHSTLVNEGLTRYECEGRAAYGIAEYLHQLTP